MKIEGEYRFDAPRDVVWKTVLDPQVLAKVLPGCEDFREVGDNEFEGLLTIKVGPVQGKFKGNVELTDLVEPSSYNMRVRGKGPPGFVDGQGQLRLEEDGGKTVLHYEVDAKVGGRIASVGQRLLDSSSKVITRQALEGLEQYIAASKAAAEGGEAPAEIVAPSQAELASKVAKGVLDDLIPPERRPMVFGIAAVVAVILGLIGIKACG
jgi:uncharacterized protein